MLMLCAFAVATSEFIIIGVMPEVAGDLGVSLPTAGLLVTAYAVAVAVGGPVLTVVARNLPRRPLLVGLMALATGAAVLSALAQTYPLLMGARILGALAQGLFLSVASQVAIASVPEEKQTAAIAKVVNGIALSTVLGVPIGTLIGQANGWRASFVLVAALGLIGLIGVLVFCPKVDHEPEPTVRESISAFRKPAILLGLATTVLSFTGMITAFTYVSPTLREVTGFAPGWVTGVLLIYGLGTMAGSWIAGRVPPNRIARVLPFTITALGTVLLLHGLLMQTKVTSVLSLFLLGTSAFATGPLLHTFLMGQAGPASGLVASVNISAFNAAAALGPILGGAVITGGLGLGSVGLFAAVPTVVGIGVALVIAGHTRRRATAVAQPVLAGTT
ncbi:MFS transporter [Amycolatopsis suaedae]|uniref:MFS transporter n=1 Tax=Amycolatopsis suaedae TaxID=2510978 RepID=A0A4Q7J7Z8_9PSEU|nr:MFS transporter [Amycolatopsis suaedae]